MNSMKNKAERRSNFLAHCKEKGWLRETAMRIVFLLAACVSIISVALICVFLLANGLPAIAEIGPIRFLNGRTWKDVKFVDMVSGEADQRKIADLRYYYTLYGNSGYFLW